MKIAHISDIHFFHPSFCFNTLISKEWIGVINGYSRESSVSSREERELLFLSFLKENCIDVVIISGDFTTVGNNKEYDDAITFVSKIKEITPSIAITLGNHDVYTKRRENMGFSLLSHCIGKSKAEQLLSKRVCSIKLQNEYFIILHTAVPTPIGKSFGSFTSTHEKGIDALSLDKPPLGVINHFPLFHVEQASRQLQGAEHAQKIIASAGIPYYFSGHTHTSSINRIDSLTCIDSGSFTFSNGALTVLDTKTGDIECWYIANNRYQQADS